MILGGIFIHLLGNKPRKSKFQHLLEFDVIDLLLELLLQLEHLLVQPNLLPYVTDHKLKLLIVSIEEALVIHDLVIDELALLIEGLQRAKLVLELPSQSQAHLLMRDAGLDVVTLKQPPKLFDLVE